MSILFRGTRYGQHRAMSTPSTPNRSKGIPWPVSIANAWPVALLCAGAWSCGGEPAAGPMTLGPLPASSAASNAGMPQQSNAQGAPGAATTAGSGAGAPNAASPGQPGLGAAGATPGTAQMEGGMSGAAVQS